MEADVIVIGMGVAGESVAGPLADAGLDVIGIESLLVGGECPYWGCIPSKMMIRAANALAEARRVDDLAGSATVAADWTPVAKRIRTEATDTWDDTVAVERFVGKGGTFVRGTGRLIADRTVAVDDGSADGQTHTARRGVVVATGTRAAVPPIDGLDQIPYWTNHEAIETEVVPESLVVLGGGAIGLELAQVFARFGSRVTVVEAQDRLLPMEEPEASEIIAEVLEAEGLDVRVGVTASAVSRGDDGAVTVLLSDGRTALGDELLVATGRHVDLSTVGVGSVGIDETLRSIPVDDRLRVKDGLWAVGDVTGKGAFTHVGTYQARIVVADILGNDLEPARYQALPRATFTDPEIGSTGKTEAEARDEGIDVKTAIKPVPHTSRGWLHGPGNEGLIKLVVDADRDVLIGATAVGPHGGEVLGMLTLAVHTATPVETLRSMIYAYPTFHRGVEDALGEL